MRKAVHQGSDIHSAISWVENNREKFNGNVYLPIFLLVKKVRKIRCYVVLPHSPAVPLCPPTILLASLDVLLSFSPQKIFVLDDLIPLGTSDFQLNLQVKALS
jgi:hypothetical protein